MVFCARRNIEHTREMKMRIHCLRASIFSGAIGVFADVLEFKNGTNADGNTDAINSQTSAGVQVSKAVALIFTARTAAPAAASAPTAPTLSLASAGSLHGAGRNHIARSLQLI